LGPLMKRTQSLSSGLIVRQDFGDAIRPVFFQTGHEDYLYATHGGTVFLVAFRGRVYGLTCGHVFQDFEYERMFITDEKQARKGSMPAPIRTLCYPSAPTDGAVGTDIVDMCVIRFADDIVPDFFKGSAYIIDEKTVATSQIQHELLVAGVLKDKSSIIPPDITIGYCQLQLRDVGASSSDPILRHAIAEFRNPEFDNIVGISGSPVFNQTANALCGMVVRGGMTGNRCNIYYIDIFDIGCFLEGVSEGVASTYYTENVLVAIDDRSGTLFGPS